MKNLVVLGLVTLCISLTGGYEPVFAQQEDGWICLFDGGDLSAMEIREDPNSFRVEDGVICAVAGKSGWVGTKEKYHDFDFRVEFKCKKPQNSGIYIHAPLWGRESSLGMELQIRGDPDQEPSRDSCGAIYGVEPPRTNALKPEGQWNRYEISYQKGQFVVRLNGELIHDIDTLSHPALRDRLTEGYIGLQNHRDDVRFRNVWIRPGPRSEGRARIEHFPRIMKGQQPALSLDRLGVLRLVASTPDGLVFSSGRVGERWPDPVLIPGTENAIQYDLFDYPGESRPLVVWSDGSHIFTSSQERNGWKAPERLAIEGKAHDPCVAWAAQWEHYFSYIEESNDTNTIRLHMLDPNRDPVNHREIAKGKDLSLPQALVIDSRWTVISSWAGLPPGAGSNADRCAGLVRARLEADRVEPVHWFTDRPAAGPVVPCYGYDRTFSMLRPVSKQKQMVWCHTTPYGSITEHGPDLPIGVWSGNTPPTPVLRPLGEGYVAAWARETSGVKRINWTWYDGLRWNPEGDFEGCAASGDPDSGFSGRSVYFVWPGTDGWIHAERVALVE